MSHTKNPYDIGVVFSGVMLLKGISMCRRGFADETIIVLVNKLILKFSDFPVISYL